MDEVTRSESHCAAAGSTGFTAFSGISSIVGGWKFERDKGEGKAN
jgi:hypothetical protein